MLKSIPRCQNYYFTSSGQKKIYGFTEGNVTPSLDIIDQDGEPLMLTDFFAIGKDLYFTTQEVDNTDPEILATKTVFYKQDKNDAVNKVASLPTKPELQRSSLSNPEFSIKDFDYQGQMCSDVNNITSVKTGPERFLLVNGYSYFTGIGLYFNIKKGRPKVRKPGLAFWPVESVGYNYVKLPEGEIW